MQNGNRNRIVSQFAAAVAMLVAVGCGSSLSLTVRPGTAAPPELIPAAPLSKHVYRKILVLPPESVDVKDVLAPVVDEMGPDYYTGLVEKVLLAQGFEVISSEIVARAGGKAGMSAVEKAMVLGKRTQAHAVLVMQKLSVRGHTNYYRVQDMATMQIDAARVQMDDGEPIDADTDECLHSVPYYEVRMQAKLLDVRNGTVLWVGSGAQSTIEVIKDDWVAEVNDDCEILSQNFVYADFMMEESTLALVVRTLLDRVVKPLSGPAFAGTPLDPPAPKVAAPPPAPTKKMAIVSTKRASLRAGPGKRKKRVMRVPRKAKVEVIETMGEWHRVKVQDGTTGWMHEDAIILDD